MSEFREQLIRSLEDYSQMQVSVDNLERQIRISREKLEKIKTSSFETICVKSNGEVQKDKVDELISYICVLENQLEITKKEVELINIGLLKNLNKTELEIIDGFYIHRADTYRKTIMNICEKLGYSEPHIVRLKRETLDKCEKILFGKLN